MRLRPKFLFGTKAETLVRLSDLVDHSVIPKLHYFSYEDWRKDSDGLLAYLMNQFSDCKIIVRSSARNEDTEEHSLAGTHESVSNITPSRTNDLRNAISQVFASYENKSGSCNDRDQVLVQEMITDVNMSGVIFTQDMNTGAPYYIINYDDQSGRTDTITSGSGEASNKTVIVLRGSTTDLHSQRFQALLCAVIEIESLTGQDALDIEFAVSRKNQVYLLQVRKIATRPNWNRGITLRVNDSVGRIKAFVRDRMKPIPGIYGSRSILGQMPDWNPAEMIGTALRPLALSLYHTLITNQSWRLARGQMGYAHPVGAPLMVSLEGVPYIDVRFSFHSYLPAGLDPAIAQKLVDAWLDKLADNRELHDKVEFEVAITALGFDFPQAVERLIPCVLNSKELKAFKESLYSLTNNLLCGKVASIDGELQRINLLEEKRSVVLSGDFSDSLLTVSSLLEDCITYGTIPFSILARHAFIARSLLLSLCKLGIISEKNFQDLMNSIQTVASKCVQALESVSCDEMPVETFLEQYGHLRPGTYNIMSARYDQRPELFLDLKNKPLTRIEQKEDFSFNDKTKKEINSVIRELDFHFTADQMLEYVSKSVTGREYAKFVFTKNVSDSLELLAHWGESVGLSRNEISFLQIDDILGTMFKANGRTLEQYLREISQHRKQQHEVTKALHLPHLIVGPQDISIIPLLRSRPNFITSKKVRAEYVFLSEIDQHPEDLSGKLVLIEGADPGFDWIFSFPIAGLITRFGGVNSHMAIRCAEFDIPAAVGVGDQLYDKILRSRTIELNCLEGMIVPVEF